MVYVLNAHYMYLCTHCVQFGGCLNLMPASISPDAITGEGGGVTVVCFGPADAEALT